VIQRRRLPAQSIKSAIRLDSIIDAKQNGGTEVPPFFLDPAE